MLLISIAILPTLGLLVLLIWLTDGLCSALKRARRNRVTASWPVMVESRIDYTDRLFGLTLKAVKRRKLPAFLPGQYLTLEIREAGTGVMRRCYSLAAWQARPERYQLGIRRVDGGAVSEYLHRHALPGSRLWIGSPAGEFTLRDNRRDVALVAGGIGVTPLRAMLHALLQGPAGPAPAVRLFHAVRDETELCYHAEFADWQHRYANFRYIPVVSRPGLDWIGAEGRLDAARILRELHAPAHTDVYLCANPAMTAALREGLLGFGIAAECIYSEGFGVGPASTPGNACYRIGIAGGGEFTFQGPPTLLHGLEQAGVKIASDCRTGHCGACRVTADHGEYRWLVPPVLPLLEREILACCTLPTSDMRLSILPT